MIQCRNCGMTFSDNAKFCGGCGAPLYAQGAPLYVKKVDEKEPFLAIIFSVILAGLGQIYCGKIARGLVILAISFVPTIFFFTFAFNGQMMDYNDIMDIVWSLIIVGILYLVFWIWQIFDAYQLSIKWNEEVERTHMKPW